MWQHIVTAEGVSAPYRHNVQQYLLILLYTMEPGLLNDAKMREEVKYEIERNIEIPCPSMLRQWVGVFLDA